MPRTTFIYLMERISNRELSTIIQGKKEIKIGISDKPLQRNKTVDRAIKGKIIILGQWKIKAASTVEAELHKQYSSDQFTPYSNKAGSGQTEFFKFYTYQIESIKRYLEKLERETSNKPKYKIQINTDDGSWILYLFIISSIITSIIKLIEQ